VSEVTMDIIISNESGIPIYEQIIAQIKEMILNGVLKEGAPLPSMRFLAKELRISIITTKRAYEELEREGYIESYIGKGSYVKTKSTELLREENLKLIEEYLSKAAGKAKISGVSYLELCEILKIICGVDENE
jgi:GntR family transcriptional regulator